MSEGRRISRLVRGLPTSDGDGVRLTRIIGSPELNHLDPFLLLDEFKNEKASDYIGGFPPHPHRGFETVTYMIAGNFTHRDSRGNEGHLTAGSVQWMTAGRGIIHSEMPAQVDGLVWGFQLWLNLPKRLKGIEPKYQDLGPERFPIARGPGLSAKVITGKFSGELGPGEAHTPVTYLDVTLDAGGTFEFALPRHHNAFAYAIEGEPTVSGAPIPVSTLAVLEGGDVVQIHANRTSRFLFVEAEPIGEPIARGGPFVMNTKEEIQQAFEDYRNGMID